jgi:hypothetical protein
MPDLTTSTPSEMIKNYVVAHVTAIEPTAFNGWVWRFGKMGATEDQVIALIDQGGPAGFPHLRVDWPGLQVLVRSARGGNGYNTSYRMIRKIRDAILGMPNSPVEFPELDGVTERGHIVPLGYDDSDRHQWSCNFQLLVEPGANAISHRASL